MTYGRDPNWNRYDTAEHTPRIDYVFANDSANAMVVNFQPIRDFKCPGHLGLEVTLNADAFDHRARRWQRPKLYNAQDILMPREEQLPLGEHLVAKKATDLNDAKGGPERIFDIANTLAEDFLD
eukprot:4079898-Pyramimonas_sp.AAC.1